MLAVLVDLYILGYSENDFTTFEIVCLFMCLSAHDKHFVAGATPKSNSPNFMKLYNQLRPDIKWFYQLFVNLAQKMVLKSCLSTIIEVDGCYFLLHGTTDNIIHEILGLTTLV